MLGLTRRGRGVAAVVAAAAGAALVDDVSNGPRVWRHLTGERRTTWNVVARAGNSEAARTLLVLAHHDAAQTGAVFDQSLQKWAGKRFPTLLSRADTSLPLWWPVVGAPALVALGAVRQNRLMTAAGTLGCGAAAALGGDIARNPVVPGANDNLSGVAALVALADRLDAEPVEGLHVMLVSCGAEEVLQGGIYGFAEQHFPQLDRRQTFVINLDTIGSPELVLLEGEGCFVMEDYPVKSFRDLIALVADELGSRCAAAAARDSAPTRSSRRGPAIRPRRWPRGTRTTNPCRTTTCRPTRPRTSTSRPSVARSTWSRRRRGGSPATGPGRFGRCPRASRQRSLSFRASTTPT